MISSYHESTYTHPESKNDKRAFIVPKHNDYRNLIFIQQWLCYNGFSGAYLRCNSMTAGIVFTTLYFRNIYDMTFINNTRRTEKKNSSGCSRLKLWCADGNAFATAYD